MHVIVVTTRGRAPWAALGVASVSAAGRPAAVHVLDVDGGYVPVADERVLRPADVALPSDLVRRLALRLGPASLADALAPAVVRAVAGTDVALVLHPGVVLVADPSPLVDAAAADGLALLPRTPAAPPEDGRAPTTQDVLAAGTRTTSLLAVRGDAVDVLADWERVASDPHAEGRWLDVVATTHPHVTLRPAHRLLSWWTLGSADRVERDAGGAWRADGVPVLALDLGGVDPDRPWLLDGGRPGDPRARLSAHPELATAVAAAAERLHDLARRDGAAPGWDVRSTSLGTPVDDVLRDALDEAGSPDPYDPAARDDLRRWLTEPTGPGAPGRWLLALRRSRPDLVAAFPSVPGAHQDAYLAWARANAAAEGYPVELAVPAATAAAPATARARRTPGINVVGFLGGDLGIGESARLVVDAARSAGIPVATVSLHRDDAGRVHADGAVEAPHDTTVLCVNADYTPVVSEAFPALTEGAARVGMWYWEVEAFPATLHGAFPFVDEVWVATDFVRDAVGAHAPVPVRTTCPPLPQRGADPRLSRTDVGYPDRPVHLFMFDYLSTAERKNPLGLLEAFTRAFGPDDGPVLVVKSINGHLRPAHAEQLRLRAAEHPHVVLREDHVAREVRDALVAHCDAYVSLHRSEGLGLTMAEAMSWGKPVVATGYSGNLQFMTDENSFLVPWTRAAIPAGASPYPVGTVWAEPDLDAAAALLRSVHDHPQDARTRGARAAQDIRERFGATSAGETLRRRFDALADVRARAAGSGPRSTLRRALRRSR